MIRIPINKEILIRRQKVLDEIKRKRQKEYEKSNPHTKKKEGLFKKAKKILKKLKKMIENN